MTTEDNATSTQQNPAQDTSTSTAKEGQSNGATFTQAQVNEMVGKTRKEARETAVADVFKELGVASKEELKALKAERDALKTSQMSDAEKLQAERDQAKKERDEALALVTSIQAERRTDRIQGIIRTAATTLKANNANTVLSVIMAGHQTAMNEVLSETGDVDQKKLDALMAKVKEQDSTLFTPPATTPGSMSNNGGSAKPSNGQPQVKRQHTAI